MSAGFLVFVALSVCAPAADGTRPGADLQPCMTPSHNLRQVVASARIAPERASRDRQAGIVIGGIAGRQGLSGTRGRLVGLAVIGGLLAGGAIGVAIEGDSCRCDDPGMSGFLIGAPIGAIASGILVWHLTK